MRDLTPMQLAIESRNVQITKQILKSIPEKERDYDGGTWNRRNEKIVHSLDNKTNW